METRTPENDAADVKSCCARLYESDFVRMLLGDSFHPGGLKLTARLGELLSLSNASRILDVACGKGDSALHLAQKFGCDVVGLDYSSENVAYANHAARDRGLSGLATFQTGDAERLPFPDACFDAVICECAFCTFPDKSAAAAEFARVLRPGGRVGISDIVRVEKLPPELDTLLAWIACIADAQPASRYAQLLGAAGLGDPCIEIHEEALEEMMRQIEGRLLGIEIAVALKKLQLPEVDFKSAKAMAASAKAAIRAKQLGYAIVIGQMPDE